MTIREAASAWGITERRITELCKSGRIPGAYKMGRRWFIPDHALKPKDNRYRKYAAPMLPHPLRKPLPIGESDYRKACSNYYYVDKTMMIKEILDERPVVSLYTRPRRFGKTLNMSMLKCFFEIGADETLFNGLYISGNRQLCEEHMGKYPVIFLSLKNVEGLTFENAKYQMAELVGREAERFGFLKQSERLSENDKEVYLALTRKVNGKYVIDDDILYASLQTLSEMLYKHYGKKTVILIDEYDVPLDKAFGHGYYREMVALIRAVFGKALKTNFALEFAVLTGCLRVSKESIFTGLNNFKILSVTDTRRATLMRLIGVWIRPIEVEEACQNV